MTDDLDQAILLIAAVLIPLGLLPFLLARIESWVAAEPPPRIDAAAAPRANPTRAVSGSSSGRTGRRWVHRALPATVLWRRRNPPERDC